MTFNISRRNLIGSTAAGIAAAGVAGSPAVFAQDAGTVAVGSKNYTEQLIMGELLAQLLEAAGYEADRQLNLGGTVVAHEALMNNDIQTYVEFTGTSLIAIMGEEVPEGEGEDVEATPEGASATPGSNQGVAGQVYDIVAEYYDQELNVEWLDPFGYNNTYALAMTREHAEELGVTKVSDLAEHASSLSIGGDAEAIVRDDAIPGLERTYGFEFDEKVTLDQGLTYSAVAEGEIDVISAFSTDGRIEALDLVLLEDDLEFFPPYYAAPIVRQDLLEELPEVYDVLNQLAGKIDNARMTSMNYQADGEGVEHSEIVRNLLIEEGIVEEE